MYAHRSGLVSMRSSSLHNPLSYTSRPTTFAYTHTSIFHSTNERTNDGDGRKAEGVVIVIVVVVCAHNAMHVARGSNMVVSAQR